MKKQMLMLILLVVAGMLIGTGGCATIMNGSTDTVNISSIPPGAKFSIVSAVGVNQTIVQTGVTPQNVTLQRKTDFFGNNYLVRFEKDGYLRKTVPMKKTVSFWFIGNIIFGGIPGIIVDCSTGAADDLHDVSVRLVK